MGRPAVGRMIGPGAAARKAMRIDGAQFGGGAIAAALARAFPALLLLFATYFLLGGTGFWTDDYWLNQHDPVTGALPPLTFKGLTIERGFFLRPLFYTVMPPIATLLWDAPWAAHLISVLVHGLVVLLAWRVMAGLGVSGSAAVAAALLFMVYPGHFEAVFWLAALPTMMASAIMLGLILLMARMARAAEDVPAWRWAVAAAVFPWAAFAICCLNEQPAMGIVALPLVYLTARPAGEPMCRGLVRSGVPTLLAGVAVLIYVYLLLSDPNKPVGARGSAEHVVALAQIPGRMAYFLDVLWRRLVMRNFARGGFWLGWEEVRNAGVVGAGFVGFVLVAGVAWAARWCRVSEAAESTESEARPRLAMVALAGLAIFAAGWAPIVAITIYDPDPRTRYWPCIGAAILLAAVASICGRLQWRATGVRRVLAGVLLAVLLAGAVCMVGIQSAFRTRWKLDQEQGRELRSLLPDPAPVTFFVPLSIGTTGVRTGSPVLDTEFRSVWEFPWTAPRYIMSVYGREDVRCGYWRSWTPRAPVVGADETGICYSDKPGPGFAPIEGGRWRIPWDRAAPFVIDGRGQLRLVSTVLITERGKDDVRMDLPQAKGRDVGADPVVVRLPRA